MSFPTNPTNAQTTTVNGITYIYNATNNAWKRQTLTDIAVSGNITAGAVVLQDGGRITSGLVYDLDEIYANGTNNTFTPRYNQSTVSVTNPWNLLVTINGIFQPAFAENSDTVWLSSTLCASRGYTVSAGNIKFADPPPAGSLVSARTQPGSAQSTTKIYPFKPVDIVLGM